MITVSVFWLGIGIAWAVLQDRAFADLWATRTRRVLSFIATVIAGPFWLTFDLWSIRK